MTWKEFKDAAEAQGVRDEEAVAWIDVVMDGDPTYIRVDRYGPELDFEVIIQNAAAPETTNAQ